MSSKIVTTSNCLALLTGLFLFAWLSACHPVPVPSPLPPPVDAAAPREIADAIDSMRTNTAVIEARSVTATEMAKKAPEAPKLPGVIADIRTANKELGKQVEVVDAANKRIEKNQLDLKTYIDSAINNTAAQLSAKDTEIAGLKKDVAARDKKIASYQDATNNWIIRVCWLTGIVLLIGGIVLRVQFPEFAMWCNGIMLGGLSALITGTIFRQILLWAKPLTIGFLVLCGAVLVYVLWRFATKQRVGVEELTEGMDAVKKTLSTEQIKALRKDLTLVTSSTTKRAVEHVKAAARLGKYEKYGDTRSWIERLLGIGDPRPVAERVKANG